MLITLKNGDGIDPETIVAVRFADRYVSEFKDNPFEHPPRVIVDFVQGSGYSKQPNCIIVRFDTANEACAYRDDLIARVNAAMANKPVELLEADKPVKFREFL